MSALPENDHGVAADTATPTVAGDEENVCPLYAIPKPEPEPGDDDDSGVFSRFRAELTPPAFWSESTPSPADELNRATFGTHLQSSGPMRRAAIGYAAVAGAWNTKDKAKIWLRSHPSRFAVAVLLLGLLALSPARPVLAWVLFGLPHLAFEALTG